MENFENVRLLGNEDVWCLGISGGYLCLFLFSSFHLGKIICYGHNPFSFQVLFVILTSLWTTIRVVFFGLNLELASRYLFLLYRIPSDLQWAVYLLILVFYLYWIQDEDALVLASTRNAKRTRTIINVVYIVLILMSFTQTVLLFVNCMYTSCDWSTLTAGSIDFELFQYVCLCIVYTVVMILVQIRRRKQTKGFWERLPKHGTLKNTMVSRKYMYALWFIFTSRMIYYWVVWFNVWRIDIQLHADNTFNLGFTAFILMFIWEFVPTFMVLWCFRLIPTTNNCLCWKSKSDYAADYDALGSQIPKNEYLRTSSYDSNHFSGILSISPLSPPQLKHSSPLSSLRVQPLQGLVTPGEQEDDKPITPNRARQMNRLSTLVNFKKLVIKTEPNSILHPYTEIGPEFASDQALAASPMPKRRRKRKREKIKPTPTSMIV